MAHALGGGGGGDRRRLRSSAKARSARVHLTTGEAAEVRAA